MKSSKWVELCVVATLFFAAAASGQESGTAPSPGATQQPSDRLQPATGDGKKPAQGGASNAATASSGHLLDAAGHDGMVNRRAASLLRLKAMLIERLSLDEAQQRKLGRMIEEYIAGLMSPVGQARAVPPPEYYALPKDLPELREQLRAAKEAGDAELVMQIEQKISAAGMVMMPSILDPVDIFLNYVASELGEEQREPMQKVIDRWFALRIREIMPDNAFKRLTRSFRDPDLNITEPQREEIIKELGKSIRALSISDRNNLEKTAELAQKMRKEVFEKLTPEQREHVQKTIALLERWNAEDEKAVEELRAKIARRTSAAESAPAPQGAP